MYDALTRKYLNFGIVRMKLNVHEEEDEMRNILLLAPMIITNCLCCMQWTQSPSQQQWDGQYFHEHTKKSFPLAHEILSHYALENYENIIDFGCGSGDITAHMAQRAAKAKVDGIDPSASMITFARGYYGNQKNLLFYELDLSTTNINLSDRYDFIFSCNAFHLLPKEEQPKILKTLEYIAKRGRVTTLLMIMAAKAEIPQPFERAYAATLQMPAWKKLQAINLDDYFQPHNEKSFPPLLANTDFIIKKMEIVDEHIIFSNTQELAHFITSWMGGFAFIAALSKEEQEQFIVDLMSNYVKEVRPADDGSIEWRSPRFVVHAEKAK